jgi:hypothetical protein
MYLSHSPTVTNLRATLSVPLPVGRATERALERWTRQAPGNVFRPDRMRRCVCPHRLAAAETRRMATTFHHEQIGRPAADRPAAVTDRVTFKMDHGV